jgi:hypothetical protein
MTTTTDTPDTPTPDTTPPVTAAPAVATPGAGYPPVPQSRNGWAIASIVLSASSIVLALGIPAVLGIVFGFIARKESAHPTDRTLANWGIGIGIFSLTWWIGLLAIGAAFALPFFALQPFIN